MAHAADHRQRASVDRARHHFFVECPQVLDAAAAAADDQHIAFGARICRRDGRRDLGARTLALHGHRIQDHRDGRHAAAQCRQHVAQCRGLR